MWRLSTASEVAAAETLVLGRRRLAAADPGRYLPELAAALIALSDLLDAPVRTEAMALAEDEVRRWWQNGPTASPPDALRQLLTLERGLVRRGRRVELVAEAVRIRRRLVDSGYGTSPGDPDAALTDLAGALTEYGKRLVLVQRWSEAWSALQEAVAVCGRVARGDPDRSPSILVAALTELARLPRRFTGGTRETVNSAEVGYARQAVDLAGRLAVTDRQRYLPVLAAAWLALSNGPGPGIIAAQRGEWDRERVAASGEAVHLLRALAATDPGRYRVDLADALRSHAHHLGWAGRGEDALACAVEAVKILRVPAGEDDDRRRYALSWALGCLSTQYRDLGRHDESQQTQAEEITIRRRLALQRPGRCLCQLADALTSRSWCLGSLGRHAEGLAAANEAVAILRPLAACDVDPLPWWSEDFDTDKLINALREQADRLSELGRHQQRVAVLGEVVEGYRRMEAATPGLYREELDAALDDLLEAAES